MNASSGMGTELDKSEGAGFLPTRFVTRTPLEILVVQSWVADHAVRLRVDDMFLTDREFETDRDEQAEEINDHYEEFCVDERLHEALIASRLFGSSLMIFMMDRHDMNSPLQMDQIREGDVSSIRVFGRYDASILEYDMDLFSPTYGQATRYRIHPNYGVSMNVHASRCLRFDGITTPGDSNFTLYERDWGVSVLVPIIQGIMQDASIAQSAAHLTQEASVPVLSINGLKDSFMGRATGEIDPRDMASQINRLKSNFRLLLLDQEDEFNRVAVQFQGIADLMDRSARRVAAACRIPLTRFWGTSPVGMNATGEGDMRNYVMTLEAERVRTWRRPYRMIDEIMFRSGGLGDTVPYHWSSLAVVPELDQMQAAVARVQALRETIDGGMMDEDEGRSQLSGHEPFGDLAGSAPEQEDPMEDPFLEGPDDFPIEEDEDFE